MEKQDLYIWEIKDKDNFPIVVFSHIPLDDCQVKELSRLYQLVSDCVSVRPMDINELKMRSPNAYAYSLAPRVFQFRQLIKMAE